MLFHYVSRNTFNCSNTSSKHIKHDNVRKTIGNEFFHKTQIVIYNNKPKHNPQIYFNHNNSTNNTIHYDNKYKQMLIKKLQHSNTNISSELYIYIT